MSHGPSDVVLFPEGWDRVAKIASEAGCAVGVTQDKMTTYVDAGPQKYAINSFGQDIPKQDQEKLC